MSKNEIEVTSLNEKSSKKLMSPKKKSCLKKLSQESVKQLQMLKDKANKKQFGRKVRDSEIIALGLDLIQDEHLTKLQQLTMSEKDRLNLAHADYIKTNGKITLDQFIGKLLIGEINVRPS